jgi:hypothetical protein
MPRMQFLSGAIGELLVVVGCEVFDDGLADVVEDVFVECLALQQGVPPLENLPALGTGLRGTQG